MRTLIKFFAYTVMLASSSVAYSETHCNFISDDARRAACLVENLRLSDDKINKRYQSLMAGLDEASRTELRNEQRAWLKNRDKMCVLDPRISDREVWYRVILQDYYKTVCVIRLTDWREQSLREMLSRKVISSDAERAPSAERGEIIAIPPQQLGKAIYDVYGMPSRSQGKWYFEIKFDAEVVKIGDATIFVGVVSNEGGVGTFVKLRPDSELPNFGIKLYTLTKNIGIAVDLDNGKLYVRENGTWKKGVPGSSRGLDLKLGREYRAVLSSSVRLNNSIDQKIIDINFGKSGFSYSLPDGYSPFGTSTVLER